MSEYSGSIRSAMNSRGSAGRPFTSGTNASAAEGEVQMMNALNLQWCFGLNKDVIGAVHDLSDETRFAIFYCAAHMGIIYDYKKNTQILLQGHCNAITATAVSGDGRWVCTADAGPDSMVIVWDSLTGTPVKTIFEAHPNGVVAMDMSPDALHLVTLSTELPQSISIWEWTTDSDQPLCTSAITTSDLQSAVCFNPSEVTELMTTGQKRVIFWNWANAALKFYSPSLSFLEFKQGMGNLTSSCFLPQSTRAVTATANGDMILWDKILSSDGSTKPDDRNVVKVVKVHDGGINVLKTCGQYVATGGMEGFVRFFDFELRLVAWFENLESGEITSLTFSHVEPEPDLYPVTDDPFMCNDFKVATRNALIIEVRAASFLELTDESKRGTLVIQAFDAPVAGVAFHPVEPLLAVTTYSGAVQLWDFEDHRFVLGSNYEKVLGHSLSFDPTGVYLGVGFTNGSVKVLHANSLEEARTFRVSKDCVLFVDFSHDGRFMATADADRCIAVFEKVLKAGGEQDWVYIGKYRAHRAAITGLTFGPPADDSDVARLISVGEDRQLVEFDMQHSSMEDGILLKGSYPVEQASLPTALLWSKLSAKEDLILTCNDAYKFRVRNAGTQMMRKTMLGPTYGGPVNKILPVGVPPPEGQLSYLAYTTAHKVVGLLKLPLDGNPNRAMGLIAHPGEITCAAVTQMGERMATCGGKDLSLFVWGIKTEPLDIAVASGGDGIDPYVAMIDGGMDGDFYNEIVDYFCYAQVKAQGEAHTGERTITGKVPLDELADLMRALGYYPSEQDVEDLINEVKYSQLMETGEHVTHVDIHTFLKLYVNHRPVFGMGRQNILDAFAKLGADKITGLMDRDALVGLLKSKGEVMSEEELTRCMAALLGEGDYSKYLDDQVTADQFAEVVLGFEAYDDDDSEVVAQ